MTASLGGFVFEVCDVEQIERSVRPNWGEFRPIYGDPVYHDTNGRVKRVRLKGKRVAKSNAELSHLESIASSKSATRLTLITGESSSVIVNDLKIRRKKWIKNGGAVEAEFSVDLTEASGYGGALGILMGVISALV